ncbi:MAG TPA: UDP-3-O-acyl-N-acetylglucosamine deacetylase [Thermoanaerobaculia bacterium]|nr:UDP-3-O-acyl-N-acetylglucosamine deacetylase [Thermoanaerobaculia bacterium]
MTYAYCVLEAASGIILALGITSMRPFRKTLSNIVAIEGVGLHSGLYTKLELRPAAPGNGIQFVRTDLDDLRIPALQSATTALDYATSVGKDDVSVGTVEHLLAALAGCGITDVDLLIDGPEVPIIDGSALPFVHLIDAAGVRALAEQVEPLTIREPLEITMGDKWIRVAPARQLRIHYTIEFNHPAIDKQSYHFEWDSERFVREIAPARTFGFLRDVEQLRAVGLARGGSVENCIVLAEDVIMNGPLRFTDEFVRHKLVDLIGDLALLGRPLVGEVTVHKGGHALHSRFVQELVRLAQDSESESSPTSARKPAETYF